MPARVVSDEEDDVYVDEEEEEEAGRLVDRDAEEDEEGNRVGDEDEDEEDEEGQDEYEKDGFIVDEDEDGEEEEEEEEEEGRKKKRKKKRESERNYVLDEDDYELLEDNVGFRRPEQSSKKFKRLKKAGRDTEEERSGFSDDEVLGGEGKDGRTAEEKLKRSLFGDDETVPLEDIAEEEEQQEEEEDMDMVEEDEMADFIVDEEDVDENGAPMPRRKIKKKKPRQAPGVSSSALQEAHEIFGDVDELLKLRKEGLERTGADSRGWVDRRIEDEFEPHIVQKNYMTPKDEMIRDTDIPERIQMIEELTGPPPVDDISIEEEASWIYNQLTSGGILSHFDHRRAVRDINKDDIGNVLTMLHVQKLDIPFITMYRKELCLSLFKDPDDQDVNLLEGISDHTKTPRMRRHTLFWAIQTLDVKWLLIQKRKSALHSYYTKRFEEEARRIYDETRLALNRQVFESIIDALKDAKSEREVDDVDMKFNLHFPPGEVDFEEGQYKRPKRKSLYSTCHKAGLWEVANKFGRSSEQFGASFECMRAADELEDAKETPEEVAANFTCVLFEKPEDVLKGARHMASVEISCEPNVRKHVRTTFMENCVISTIPTAEGNMVIDEFHQFYEVKWLKEKPFSSFINAQWLLAQKAEEEKLLKVTIKLPGAIQEKLMTDARDYYLSLNMSRTAKMWNEQRQRILDDSFFNFILPSMEKEARSLLTSKAKSWLLMEYGRQLWKWVSVAPYVKAKPGDKTESEEESALRVIACSWGPGKSGITFVALDSSGELLDVMQAGTLPRKSHGLVEQRKRNDEQRLLKFISDHRPEVFSIGATNTHCTDLKDWISEINYKILEERENSFYNGPEVPLFFADEALPRVYENSQVSSDQLSGQQGIVRRAVALGRYLQNPLAMVATLCGIEREILSCKLCPLENFLTADEKYGMVEQVMVDATNQVGIDLNMACGHEWLLAPLQFTSGLGPRKAAALQRAFVRAGSVLSRKEIMMGVIRKKVFVNASGFLRVRPCGAAGTSGYVMDLLDDTRIHPESYDLAKQMAKDVYSHDDSDEHVEIEDDVQEMVIEQIRENPHQLELLMIEEYHKSVEAEKNCRKLETLYDIKRELIRGFQDCRTPYIEPDADELFRMVSGETDESISEGKIVQVTVRYVQEQRVSCSLDSGLHGFISIGDFSDQRLESSELQEMVHKDDMLTCKIKRVEKNRFLVHLTHKDGDLNRKHVPKNLDRFFVEGHAHIRNEDIARKEKEMGKKNFKPRMIVHPRFHNWTSEEAIEFLVDKEIGESVFRPSVRGPSHLTLTIKVYEGLYTHKDIDESDKDHKDITSLLRLGKKLSIGKDTFEDLDELVDRYVDPLVSRLKSMYAYRKFREGNQAEVEDLLRKEKAEYPMRIVYCFSIADKHPGIFVLTYIRSTAPHHRYVAVYPTGFRFQQRDFDDIDRLVAYFQKHIDDNPTSNMSMRSLAAVVPMRSPAPVDSSSRDSVDDGWSGGGWQAQNDSEGERLTPGSRVDHRHDGSSREGHPSGLPRSSGRGRGRGRGTHDSQVLGYDSTKWGPGSKENDGMSSFPGAKVQNSPGRERFPGSWGGGGRSGGRGDWGAKAQDSPGRERFPGSWGGSGGSGGSGGWRGAKAQDSPARERFPGSWGGGGGNSGGGGAKGQDSPGRERFPGSWGGGGSSQDSSGKERFPGSWSRGGTSGSSGSWGSKHQDSPGGERFPRGGGGGGGRDGGRGSGGGRDGGGGSGGGWGARVQDSPGGKERFPGSWGGGGGGWSGGSKHDGGGSDEGGGGWGGGSKHDGGGDDGWGGGSKHDGDDGGSTTSNRGRNTREGGDSDGWNAAGSEGNNGGHTRGGNNWGN